MNPVKQQLISPVIITSIACIITRRVSIFELKTRTKLSISFFYQSFGLSHTIRDTSQSHPRRQNSTHDSQQQHYSIKIHFFPPLFFLLLLLLSTFLEFSVPRFDVEQRLPFVPAGTVLEI